MKLDALQGVKRLGGYVARATMRADQDRHVLNDEKRRATPVAASQAPEPNPGLSAYSAP